MQPIASEDLVKAPYMRLLNLGGPKVGKTYTTIVTAQKLGGVYVINSDDQYSLIPAVNAGARFHSNLILGSDPQEIEGALHVAATGVADGAYKVIIWDTITKYAFRAEEAFEALNTNEKGNVNNFALWRGIKRHIHYILDRLFLLDAHIIVNAHWTEFQGRLIEGQNDKNGAGIMPSLPGDLRMTVPRDFQDVVFLDKRREGRVFLTSVAGVWGPGARQLEEGIEPIEADVSVLWEKLKGGGAP